MFPAGPTLQCVCGKSFLQLAGLNHHTRTCTRSKKHIVSALSKAKQVFSERRERKRQRREESVLAPNEVEPVVSVSVGSIYFSYDLFHANQGLTRVVFALAVRESNSTN
jgi:hypothetical protein